MNTNKHLDEKVRKALEDFHARPNAAAWDAFEQRLDQEAAAENAGKAPRSFDDVVLGKLNGLEVPFMTGDWSRMEKMIEAEEAAEKLENEALIDNAIGERLENFSVAYQPHHWQIMASRLEEEFYFRYHLIRCKAAEVGLMLLLLLTIVHFTPVINEDNRLEGKEPALQMQPAGSPIEKTTSPKAQNQPKNVPIAAADLLPSRSIQTQTSTRPSDEPSSRFDSTTETSFNAGLNSGHLENNSNTLPSAPLAAILAQKPPTTLFEEMVEKKFAQNTLPTPGKNDDGDISDASLIASLDAQPIQSNFAWETLELPPILFHKEPKLRFSIFTTTDFAYVITPPNKYSVFDTLVTTGRDTTLASGYGGGILVSWKKDKWEIQTGGVYSFKRYIPNTPVFLFETVSYYIREEFNGVQLDILQIPLNASYHFKNQGKWRMYGNIGASANLIASSVYEIKTDKTPSFSKFAMMPIPNELPADNKSIREEKEFPDGLFDGGSLQDNFYLTANIGVGVERFVSPHWSVFLQPNYQHHFLTDGIGANGEKLYNFSFYLGTKVSLK